MATTTGAEVAIPWALRETTRNAWRPDGNPAVEKIQRPSPPARAGAPSGRSSQYN